MGWTKKQIGGLAVVIKTTLVRSNHVNSECSQIFPRAGSKSKGEEPAMAEEEWSTSWTTFNPDYLLK